MSFDQFLKAAPAIIKQASQTPLGILALIILSLSGLAWLFFASAKPGIKVAIFCSLLLAGVLYGIAILRTPFLSPPVSAVPAIAGRVLDDATDGGIQGAKVILEGGGSPAPQDDTDSDGTFRFKSIENTQPENLRITVLKEGYDSVTRRLSKNDPVSDLRIRLKRVPPPKPTPSAGFQGAVLAGTVRDRSTKQPIRGAKVAIRGLVSPAPEAFTDTSGQFYFELPIKRRTGFRIFVEAPGHESFDRSMSVAEDWKNVDVRLEPVP